jgi:signal transduction histidine kinase
VSARSLAAVERAAVAEEVASLLRHDLRNRLAVVRNAATYMRKKLSPTDAWRGDPRLETFAKILETEIAAANELLSDRLSLGHLFARRVSRVEASECIAFAIAEARAPRTSAVEVDARSCDLTIDASELALAVRCLVDNALEASNVASAPVRVRVRADADRCVIEIVDAGAGIASDRLSDAQRAFYTTKEGHAGLGLNIASRIATRYGGKLEIVAAPGGGACAVLSLSRGAP